MEESIKDIIDIIESLDARINSYWNFYMLIVTAAIGWLMSSTKPFTVNQSIVLTVTIFLFFLVSFFIIRAATKRVIAFESELNLISKNLSFKSCILKNELSNNSMPLRLIISYSFHIIVDVAVIYAIWSKVGLV